MSRVNAFGSPLILGIILSILLSGGIYIYKTKSTISTAQCDIENCHGLDIACGSNIPETCTKAYLLGDRCRVYANCQVANNSCQFIQNEQFNNCKDCVKKCLYEFPNDQIEALECESKCR